MLTRFYLITDCQSPKSIFAESIKNPEFKDDPFRCDTIRVKLSHPEAGSCSNQIINLQVPFFNLIYLEVELPLKKTCPDAENEMSQFSKKKKLCKTGFSSLSFEPKKTLSFLGRTFHRH